MSLQATLFHPSLIGWMFARLLSIGSEVGVTENALLYFLGRDGSVSFNSISFLWGARSGALGETSLVMTVLGGGLLLMKKLVRPAVPFLFLLAALLVARAVSIEPTTVFFLTPTVWIAFFIVTDPESSPARYGAKQLYAALSGAAFVLATQAMGRPEAGLFSLIFMNATVPAIDRAWNKWIKP